jgi:hypothetical protein
VGDLTGILVPIGGGSGGSPPTIPVTTIAASTYGILPANSAATNDTGFAALRAAMRADTTKTWHVVFAPGAYTYTNNRWLFGVLKCIIEAYDCTFQNMVNDSWELNSRPLNTGDYFNDVGDFARTGANDAYVTGSLFNTAVAGSYTITTTTAANAGNFTAGMRVVLHGYDQQGTASYPFNLRYFEVKTVVSGVAGTGVVTFTTPLSYAYDSRWWDTVYGGGGSPSFGAPRILSIERTRYTHPKLFWFKGMTFLVNGVNANFGVLTCSADLVIMEDVKETIFSPTTSDKTIYRRCKGVSSAAIGGGASEVDKLLGSVIFEDCYMDGTLAPAGAINAATGCVSLSLIRTTCVNGCNNIAPRHLLIDDCDIIGKPQGDIFGAISATSFVPITSLNVCNTRIYYTGGIGVGVDPGVLNGITFTVGSVNGTNIQLVWNGTSQTLAHAIDYGMTLSKSDGTKSGVITGIFLTGGNTLVITGSWAAPVAAETWQAVSSVINQSDGGGNSMIGTTTLPFWRYGSEVTLSKDVTIPGSPTINGPGLYFSNVANTLIQNANSMQFVVNGVTVFYLGGAQINMGNAADILFATGHGVRPLEGTNGIMGTTVLVAGTKTVSTTAAGANSRIFLTSQVDGGTPGFLRVTAIVNGTSFTITSSNGADTSTVAWQIVNKQ